MAENKKLSPEDLAKAFTTGDLSSLIGKEIIFKIHPIQEKFMNEEVHRVPYMGGRPIYNTIYKEVDWGKKEASAFIYSTLDGREIRPRAQFIYWNRSPVFDMKLVDGVWVKK